jgi:ABC-type transport system involved in cytochrome bd biosynthesis fused ATPase/permease subunit
LTVLPHGLDTPIAAHGAAAPGPSFAPKLALARLLLHDGRVLLIDELPNAIMSGTTGARLRSLLAGWKRRKTVLVVTQREDVMALADQVVTLSRHGHPRCLARRTSADGARKAAA